MQKILESQCRIKPRGSRYSLAELHYLNVSLTICLLNSLTTNKRTKLRNGHTPSISTLHANLPVQWHDTNTSKQAINRGSNGETSRHGTDTSSFPPNKRNQSTKRNRASFPRSRDGLIGGASCRSSFLLVVPRGEDQKKILPLTRQAFSSPFFVALLLAVPIIDRYHSSPGDRFPRFCRPSAGTDTYETRRAIRRFLPADSIPVSPEHRRYVGN